MSVLTSTRFLIAITLFISILFCDARFTGGSFSGSLDKRQNGKVCEVSCSPATCGSSSCPIKRRRTLESAVDVPHDYKEGPEGTNSTDPGLFKRILKEVNEDEIGKYVDDQNEQSIVKKLCPTNAGGFDYPSFCIQEEFSMTRFERSQIFIGTANTVLTGCTVMMVVSSRAVYACHFWQDLHYRSIRRPYYGFDPILNMIRGAGATPGAVGPALDRGLFTGTNDHSWAFIMTPRSGSTPNEPTSKNHPGQHRDLVGLLKNLVPGIGLVTYNYNPFLNDDDPQYSGQALFEYDRDADGNGNADWRVWMEAQSFRATTNLGLEVAK